MEMTYSAANEVILTAPDPVRVDTGGKDTDCDSGGLVLVIS